MKKSTARTTLKNALYKNSSAPVEERVEDLLSRMTLQEKLGQASQVTPRGRSDRELNDRIKAGGIGSLIMADSMFAGNGPQSSVNLEKNNDRQRMAMEKTRLGIPILYGRDVIHGHVTVWPVPLGTACTWDPDLAESSASLIAEQATSLGIKWAFAPMVDISRDPRWGRIAESFGEDPYLSGLMGAAIVKGYQGRKLDDLKKPGKMAACLKHYIGYGGAEGGRDYNTVEWGENTLMNMHLPPFRAGVKAGAQTVMSGFHEISGEPMSSNRFLLTDVLRKRLGFDGFVVSDWGSVWELINHRRAESQAHAAELSIHAGIDMDMCTDSYYGHLTRVIKENPAVLQDLDEAVRRILRVKFRLGLFENPYADEKKVIGKKSRGKYKVVALEAARRSAILLKNEGNILPIHTKEKKIAIVGPMIDEKQSLMGTWNMDGDPDDVQSIQEAFRSCPGDFTFASNMQDVGAAVQFADMAILFVGEQASRSGENNCVTDISLPIGQDDLIWECARFGKPFVVVALTGRPVILDAASKLANAVVLQFHAGTMTAQSLVDILLGTCEPVGRLAVSLPHVSGQVPVYYNHKNTGRPTGWFSGFYRHSPKKPLYPFGYGLGYSTFAVSRLKVETRKIKTGGKVKATVKVKNTGSRAGETVVQLYLCDEFSKKTRPVRELKAFQRVRLAPGKSKELIFTLGEAELGYYGSDNKWCVEPGVFTIFAGLDSNTDLSASFTVVE